MSLETTGVDFKIYLDEFRKDIKEIKSALGSVSATAENEAKKTEQLFGTAFKAAGGLLAFDKIKDIADHIQDLTANFEKYEAVLTTSLGTQKEAVSAMDELQKFASDTPFQLNNLTDSYVKLVGQGFKPTMAEMTNLGDLASSKTKGFDQLTEAILDAMMGENERLKEFGIKAKDAGDKVQYTFKGVPTLVEKNEEAIKNYILSLGKMEGVAGSMAAISKTLGGQMSNAADATDNLSTSIGSRLSPSLTGLYGDYTRLVNRVAEWIRLSPADKLRDERDEVNMLVVQLRDANIGEETRLTLLTRLKELSPELAKVIEDESTNMDSLSKSLETYNKNMALKILMAEKEMAIEKQRSGKGGVQDYQRLMADQEADLVKKMNESLEWFAKKGPQYVEQVKKILVDDNLETVEKAEQINRLALKATTLGNSRLYLSLDAYKGFKQRYYLESYSLKQMIEEANALVERYKDILGVKDETAEEVKNETVTQPKNDNDLKNEFDKWKEHLQKLKQEYQEYEAVKTKIGKDEADKLYSDLLVKAATYKDYLEKLLTGKLSKSQVGYVALELSGFTEKEDKKDTKTEDNKVDEEIAAFERLLKETSDFDAKMDDLFQEYWAKRAQLEGKGLSDHIAVLDKQFEADFAALVKTNGAYDWLYKSIDNYSRKELKNYIARIQKEIELSQMSAEQRIELEKALAAAQEKLDQKLADNLSDVASILGEAANLAAVFDANLAKALSTGAELAGAAASIAAGFASGNYAQAITGIIQAATVVAKLFKKDDFDAVADAAGRIESSFKQIERTLSNINGKIENALGIDKIAQLNAGLRVTEALLEKMPAKVNDVWAAGGGGRDYSYPEFTRMTQELNQIKAKHEIGTKGYYEAILNNEYLLSLFSEQQINALQEQYNMYNELEAQQRDYQNQLNEMMTGTTFDSLRSELVGMFEDGKLSVADFAEYFEKMMKKAIIESLSVKYLDEKLAAWYDLFGTAMEDGVLTDQERADLKEEFDATIKPAMDQITEATKFIDDLNGTTNAATGEAIKGIDQATGNILAGHLGNVRVNVAALVSAAAKHLEVLNSMDKKLGNIEKHTKDTRDALQNTSF